MGAESPARPTIEVDLLGSFRLRVDGRPVSVPAARLRAMLGVLAMSADRPVSVDRLADAVWGDQPPDRVRSTLQTYVSRLRGVLGAAAITTELTGYALRTEPDSVDARRFTRLVDAVDADPRTSRQRLGEALRLWRGVPFEDLDSAWLCENEGPWLEERRLAALERRIDLDLAARRYAEVATELGDLTAEHPLREAFGAQFLRALAGCGRQADALEQYEAIRTRIADELGVDPSEDLQRLHAQLLDGSLAVGSGDRDTTAIMASLAATVAPRQLPADIARFTGRSEALAALDAQAQRSVTGHGVVAVVHGVGGVGKTSLVVHWAHRAAHRFPDGQLYINLRGFGDGAPLTPSAALEILLRGLGTGVEQIPTDQESRSSLLRSLLADRRILVVLDNAREAEQVRPLLPGSASSMAVVTSRSGLSGLIAREDAFRLGVDQLDPAESVRLLATTLDTRGIPHEEGQLISLADQCGHLPLALAIAVERASREPHAGLGLVLEELQHVHTRLDVLNSGDDTTDLRTVFAWSYQNLDETTAQVFRLLGTYPPVTIGIPAAAALVGTSNTIVRGVLDQLVDANLLLHQHRGRYEFHDLIRTYAAELADRHLSVTDRDAAFHRLLDWCAHSVDRARNTLNSLPALLEPHADADACSPLAFADADAAVRWFGTEQTALIATAGAAIRHVPDRRAFVLVDALAYHLGHLHTDLDWTSLLAPAIAAAQHGGDLVAEAQLSHRLGLLNAANADYELAYRHIEHGRLLFSKAGHLRGEIRTLDNLGVVMDFLGDPNALGRQEDALKTARRLGDRYEEINPMNNLADSYVHLSRIDQAVSLCEEALKILSEQRNDPAPSEGMIWDTLASARVKQERYDDAIECYTNALAASRRQHNRWGEAIVLTNLGKCLRATQRHDEARDTWQEVLAMLDDLGVSNGMYISRKELLELLASVTPSRS